MSLNVHGPQLGLLQRVVDCGNINAAKHNFEYVVQESINVL